MILLPTEFPDGTNTEKYLNKIEHTKGSRISEVRASFKSGSGRSCPGGSGRRIRSEDITQPTLT